MYFTLEKTNTDNKPENGTKPKQGRTDQRYELAGPSTRNLIYEDAESNRNSPSARKRAPQGPQYEINEPIHQNQIYEDAGSSLGAPSNSTEDSSKPRIKPQSTPYEINEPIHQNIIYEGIDNPTMFTGGRSLPPEPFNEPPPAVSNSNDVYAMPDMEKKSKKDGRLQLESASKNQYEIESNESARADNLYTTPDMELKEKQQNQQATSLNNTNNGVGNSAYEINELKSDDVYAMPDIQQKARDSNQSNETDSINIYYAADNYNKEHDEFNTNPIYG